MFEKILALPANDKFCFHNGLVFSASRVFGPRNGSLSGLSRVGTSRSIDAKS